MKSKTTAGSIGAASNRVSISLIVYNPALANVSIRKENYIYEDF